MIAVFGKFAGGGLGYYKMVRRFAHRVVPSLMWHQEYSPAIGVQHSPTGHLVSLLYDCDLVDRSHASA